MKFTKQFFEGISITIWAHFNDFFHLKQFEMAIHEIEYKDTERSEFEKFPN